MNSRKFIASLVCCALVLLFALGVYAPRGAAAPVVSGVYKVTDTTDLGAQMRVTLQIRLTNAGEERIFVTQTRLRGLLHAGRSEDKPVHVILDPRGGAEFTQDFIVAKQEYGLWGKGVRPHLGLRMQVAGGQETSMTITLTQLPGSR
jgi:hypothetical protein